MSFIRFAHPSADLMWARWPRMVDSASFRSPARSFVTNAESRISSTSQSRLGFTSSSRRSSTPEIFSAVRGASPGTTSRSYRSRKSAQPSREGVPGSPVSSWAVSSPASRSASLRFRAGPSFGMFVALVRSFPVAGSRHWMMKQGRLASLAT